MISVSADARARFPALATYLHPARTDGLAFAVVTESDADGDLVLAPGDRSMVGRCADGRLRLTVANADVSFASALIIAAAHGERPVAADPQSVAQFALAAKVAARDVAVLVTGPTGTGKEGLARYVHERSGRRTGPFVAVNCAAIPETMLEATLFGYERGAYTGAVGSAPGLFRAASGGTLLLDEIGELPLALQAKLLRALQEREVLPVGASMPVRFDARIVATANRDLQAEVAGGRFRADLFYRLAVFSLATTALATRPGDILPIAAALWLREAIPAWPTPAALAKLTGHGWPGNVRELGNVIARAGVVAEDGTVGPDEVIFDRVASGSATLGSGVRRHEHDLIRSTLAACNGRRGATAERLGISERTLRYKLAAMVDARSATVQ